MQEIAEISRPGRRHERFDIVCRARIRIRNRQYAAALENISVSGARITTFSSLRDAGPATLLLPDLLPLQATLLWAEDRTAGIVFDQLLNEEHLEEWLKSRLVWQAAPSLPIDQFGRHAARKILVSTLNPAH